MRFIYYLDSAMKIPMRGGIEDLPERSMLHVLLDPQSC
jgi:hypothetical protein